MIAFDTHEFIKQMVATGFTEEQAETQVRLLSKILDTQLSTKADVGKVDLHVLELKRDIKELDVKIKELDVKIDVKIKELDAKIEVTKTELQRDIKELDAKLETRLKELELKIEITKTELKRDIKELDVKLEARLKELELRFAAALAPIRWGVAVTVGGIVTLVVKSFLTH